MGHTIPPKRQIIYSKLESLKKFTKTLRQPYRGRFERLVNSVYNHISSIVFTNSLDDEEMMIYSMLVGITMSEKIEDRERILRCMAILLTK